MLSGDGFNGRGETTGRLLPPFFFVRAHTRPRLPYVHTFSPLRARVAKRWGCVLWGCS